jgi:hypothetical protein
MVDVTSAKTPSFIPAHAVRRFRSLVDHEAVAPIWQENVDKSLEGLPA